jgi:hypothetical protein
MMTQDIGLALEPAMLNVVTISFKTRHDEEGMRVNTAHCHFWELDSNNVLDILRVIDGRLARVAVHAAVSDVEVIDE